MKLAIMQPYLFPYLGYFQLIRAVDAFVIYDDVNFIKGGWINRNYILTNNDKQLFTLPLKGVSQNKLIKQIEVSGPHKILKNLHHNYNNAPHFNVVYPIIKDILTQTEKNLGRFLDYQLRRVCEYIGLSPQWYISSELAKNNSLCGQHKIISICEELRATHYINAYNGISLYDKSLFEARGLNLSFIRPRGVSYQQFSMRFTPNLSIIDVMMFNDRDQCAKLLEEYELV